MNILHLATTYQSLVTILAPKLEVLAARPGICLFCASSYEDPTETRIPSGAYLRIDIPRTIKPVADIAAIFRLARLVRKHRIDLIHTHTAKAGIVGAVTGFLARVAVIHSFHGLPFYDGQAAGSYRLYRAIEKGASRLRKMVFSQNKGDYDLLVREKLLTCPVVYEGNGVDCERVRKMAHEQKGCDGFVTQRLKILCVARLEPVKRISDLIAAIAALKSGGFETECIIAGKGELEHELKKQIHNAGCESNVRILYTACMYGLMNQADLVVLVSQKEGIPRAIMEAMALGKAVVATSVPGTKELVRPGETGVLVPLGDKAALAGALRELGDNRSLREQMGVAGRELVERNYDERGIVDLWTKWYAKVSK